MSAVAFQLSAFYREEEKVSSLHLVNLLTLSVVFKVFPSIFIVSKKHIGLEGQSERLGGGRRKDLLLFFD